MKANDHGPQRSSLISADQAKAVPFGPTGGARSVTRHRAVTRELGAARLAHLLRPARLSAISAVCCLFVISATAAVPAGAAPPGVPLSWLRPGPGSFLSGPSGPGFPAGARLRYVWCCSGGLDAGWQCTVRNGY